MQKMRRKILISGAVIVILAAAVLLYWQNQKVQTRPLRIVMIQKAIDDTDFWTSLYKGGEMAAAEYDVELAILGPKEESQTEKQHQMILDAIAEKPDAIALAPASFDETVPYAEQITEAGITLVLMDSAMEKEMGESMIATDNFEAGFKMGEYMKQFVTPDTVIGIVGHVQGTSTAVQREAGFRAGLGEAERQVASVVFCDSSSEKAYELTCGMLEEYPGMNMIVGLNEYSAVGAARAVKEYTAPGSVYMAGFDSSKKEIQLLEEGVFDAIVIQKPFNMGYLAIETAVKAVRGENVKGSIDSGSELITKENMYTEENQKLLFPFFGGE